MSGRSEAIGAYLFIAPLSTAASFALFWWEVISINPAKRTVPNRLEIGNVRKASPCQPALVFAACYRLLMLSALFIIHCRLLLHVAGTPHAFRCALSDAPLSKGIPGNFPVIGPFVKSVVPFPVDRRITIPTELYFALQR